MGVIKINNIIYGSNNSADIMYKDITVEEKLNSIPVFDPSDNANIEANQYDYLTYGHIVDVLNSSDTDKVLSANQGRILKESIENIDFSELENGITSLNSEINNLNLNKANKDELNTLSNSVNDLSLSVNQQYINSGYGRIRFKWDDSTGYLRAAVDNTENVANLKGHVTIPFSFGVDENGNYGYIKDGADTVTPFKKPCRYYDVYIIVTGTSSYGNISSRWHIDTSNWNTLTLTGNMRDENNSSLVIKANSSNGATIYTFSSRTATTVNIDVSQYNSIYMQVVCSRNLSAGAWGTYIGQMALS